MDAEAAGRRWIDAWRQAWPAKDHKPLAAVYADDAAFRSPSVPGAASGSRRCARVRGVGVRGPGAIDARWFGEPSAGDRATVEYRAVLVESGAEVTIAGVALLRFDSDGRVRVQRDYWSLELGGREPPEGWGN